MKRFLFLAGFVCLIAMLLPACAPAPEPKPAPEPVFDQAAEEAAIRAVMDRMYAALDRHDPSGVVAEMDEVFETWEGDMKGLAAREKYWAGFFEANKNAKITLQDEIGIIFVTPDVAIFKARGEATGWGNQDREFLAASVLAKKNGKWLEVAAFNRPIEE